MGGASSNRTHLDLSLMSKLAALHGGKAKSSSRELVSRRGVWR